MNYIDNTFRYTNASIYDRRSIKPIEKYIKSIWDPILINTLRKNISPNDIICDLGSGTFEYTQYMGMAKEIFAVEINKKMIDGGTNKIKHISNKVNILCENALSSSIANKSCSIVWIIGLLEYVDLHKIFDEIGRVSKNKTKLFIQFPNLFHPYNFGINIIYKILGIPIKKYHTLSEVKTIARQNGFILKKTTSRGIFLLVPESVQDKLIWLWKILEKVVKPIQSIFPLGINVFCEFEKG
ncbi:MAG: methyltransferase domain-containing protein [Microgenomates group bacterium]